MSPPTGDARGDASAASRPASALGDRLDEARALSRLVAESLDQVAGQVTRFERRLEESELDAANLATRLVASEAQCSRLMNLYVATYQLHATLDPAEVRATIAEILISLLGAERFVLLLRGGSGALDDVALAEGLDGEMTELYADGDHERADPMLAASMADRTLRIGPMEGSRALAAVPLVVQDVTIGLLVILKMLDHRGGLSPADRELLDLLGAHAASALFTAQIHANADRKLRTLESLMTLARRG